MNSKNKLIHALLLRKNSPHFSHSRCLSEKKNVEIQKIIPMHQDFRP